MDGLGSLIEGKGRRVNGEGSSPVASRTRARDHLLEWSGVGVDQVKFIHEMLGDDDGKVWGWPSPMPAARKRWSRWWWSSSVPSSTDPPTISGEKVVDFVSRDGFFLHGLVGIEHGKGEEASVHGERQQKGEVAWVRWGSGGVRYEHMAQLLCTNDTHTRASPGQSARKKQTV